MINKKTYSLKIKHNQGAVPVNSEGSDRRFTLTQLLVTSFFFVLLHWVLKESEIKNLTGGQTVNQQFLATPLGRT